MTKVGAVEQATKAPAVIASNAALPTAGVRIFSAPAGGATSVTTTGLYPFTDGYSFYSGTSGCAENRPDAYAAGRLLRRSSASRSPAPARARSSPCASRR